MNCQPRTVAFASGANFERLKIHRPTPGTRKAFWQSLVGMGERAQSALSAASQSPKRHLQKLATLALEDLSSR